MADGGKTPESDNEYYYVITDNFPSTPICFSGTPSSDFIHKQDIMGSGPNDFRHRGDKPPGRGQPDAEELLKHMDQNRDGKLSKDEVKGPLIQDFDRLDNNKDGFLT